MANYNAKTAIVISLNIGACLCVLAIVATASSADGRYAVMAPPGSRPEIAFEIVARAGGMVLAPGGLDGIVIAQSDAPDFRARLAKEGAFLIFNPLVIGGCRPAL